MKILFIMDPFSRVHPQKDSTYLMICESLNRKFTSYFCEQTDLAFHQKNVLARCQEIKKLEPNKEKTLSLVDLGKKSLMDLSEFSVVLMRTDPPIDFKYFSSTYLLDLYEHKTLIINHSLSLKNRNEKFYMLRFPSLIPPTLVSNNHEEIKDFLNDQGGKGVLKPFFQSGGEGVFFLNLEDPNINVILEAAIGAQHHTVMVQKYIPEVKKGDKRIIVIDGEPEGAVLRISTSQDHRSNIHLGGRTEKTTFTPRDRDICAALKQTLLDDQLFFVGLDVIGDYLTEINFTSPTGFQEINRLEERKENRLEKVFFDKLVDKLNLWKAKKSKK